MFNFRYPFSRNRQITLIRMKNCYIGHWGLVKIEVGMGKDVTKWVKVKQLGYRVKPNRWPIIIKLYMARIRQDEESNLGVGNQCLFTTNVQIGYILILTG